jgi:hypothetical protein
MQNIIAVFNNRNQALQFATTLKRLGIKNKITDTPRELSTSCGISVIFDGGFLGRAKLVIEKLRMVGNVKLYIIGGDIFKKYRQI